MFDGFCKPSWNCCVAFLMFSLEGQVSCFNLTFLQHSECYIVSDQETDKIKSVSKNINVHSCVKVCMYCLVKLRGYHGLQLFCYWQRVSYQIIKLVNDESKANVERMNHKKLVWHSQEDVLPHWTY